jgi:peptidyl-tRNA hydrolase, PTH2 family
MKQVIVVNGALNLPAGKLAAQVSHAAVGAFLAATTDAQSAWIQAGMPKIVVYANDDASRS